MVQFCVRIEHDKARNQSALSHQNACQRARFNTNAGIVFRLKAPVGHREIQILHENVDKSPVTLVMAMDDGLNFRALSHGQRQEPAGSAHLQNCANGSTNSTHSKASQTRPSPPASQTNVKTARKHRHTPTNPDTSNKGRCAVWGIFSVEVGKRNGSCAASPGLQGKPSTPGYILAQP